MKKHMSLYLFISLFLNSMDAPKKFPSYQPLTMSNCQFFERSNDLDKMGAPTLVWNSKKDIEVMAYLHILQNSNIDKKDLILNIEFNKGDIAHFLTTKADNVIAFTQNQQNMNQAQAEFKHPKLTFTPLFSMIHYYDLIVTCHPVAEMGLLQKTKSLLNHCGEIFCLFNTNSNKKHVLHEVFENMKPVLKKNLSGADYKHLCSLVEVNFPRPTDALLKKMIAQSELEIITYEQKAVNILIVQPQQERFLTDSKAFFMDLPIMNSVSTKQEKTLLANIFIENIIKIIKSDDSGNWIYPFDFTIVHIKKD